MSKRSPRPAPSLTQTGALVLNADDWGVDPSTTDRIFDCFQSGTISSTSALMLMEDSDRAARIAIDHDLDTGLHLNFTTPFSSPSTPPQLVKDQESVSRFLRSSRFAPAMFHPGLAGAFRRLVAAQLSEFVRLYGKEPWRIDGHHHMHLCSNVIYAALLPPGVVLRCNSSFFPGENGLLNRVYRRIQDKAASRKHPMPDYLFELSSSMVCGNWPRICTLARHYCVEIEAHPVNPAEYELLTCGRIYSLIGDLAIAHRFPIGPRVLRSAC